MSGVRISLKVGFITVFGLLPVGLNRHIDWHGGRAEFEAMRAELRAAMDAAVSKAKRHSPINYVDTHHLWGILYAIAASASEDEATQDAAARWLISWVLSQPVPDYGGIYADYLDKDWLFNLADEGHAVSMIAAPSTRPDTASPAAPNGKRRWKAGRRQRHQRRPR